MGYMVEEMLKLLQFSKGYSGLGICRETGIKPFQLEVARNEDVLTRQVSEKLARRFGEDWNSISSLREYQRQKNIADNVDMERLTALRQQQGYSIRAFSAKTGIGTERVAKMENGLSHFNSWQEYVNCKELLKDDLLKSSAKKEKKKQVITKEFITFDNVGGHWEMGKRVKREVI